MMVIVGWVLRLAPIGVFVLASGVTLNAGLGAIGALAQIEALQFMAPISGIALCYLIARLGGGVSFAIFARAAAGPQAIAAGTCSSMATLPAMINAAESKLGVAPAMAGSVLPLAVSTFRFGNVILITSTTLFAAWAAGVHPSVVQIGLGAAVIILTNVGIAGVPAAAVIYASMAPGFMAMGAPLALIPLLIATAAPSDVFDTTCNVTGDLAATTVVRRLLSRRFAAPPAVEITVETAVVVTERVA
jgi:Na+/H+-dicarboxylate symporter